MATKKNNFEYDAADIPARLDTGDVPSRSQASLESFTNVTDSNRVLIHELRELLREAEAENPAATAAALTKALSPEKRAQFFNAMLVKEVDEAGLFPQVKANYNELADTFSTGGYPYKHRYPLRLYEKELYDLQVELLKLQEWVKNTNQKIVVIFEGRDAAGKGGTIRRFTENLNPRGARIVALSKPTDEEKQQWYFQRYVAQLPKPGEICFFDRSWYNRAVVEPVMGFCTQEQTEMFLSEVPTSSARCSAPASASSSTGLPSRRKSSSSASASAATIRSSSGRFRRSTSPPSTSGTTTPRRSTTCSTRPT
jgi:hypothetical protein